MRARPVFAVGMWLLCLAPAVSAKPTGNGYQRAVRAVETQRRRVAVAGDSWAKTEAHIIASVRSLSAHWLGTPWGLGAPQTDTPHVGKINCGTFVGTILRDAGFRINVRKLQRQPSQLIIQTFVGRSRTKKFSNAPMEKFLSSVRAMGPGLFVIGLDFHVGFLVQTKSELRFVHASYETGTVINEDAAKAMPITSSRYRVVGKLLSRQNLRDWRRGRRIPVIGRW